MRCGFRWNVIIAAGLLTLGSDALPAPVEPPSRAVRRYTLEELYQAAVRRSENIAISLEEIQKAEQLIRQARGSLFPAVSGVASYTRLDEPSDSETAFTRANRPEVRLTLTQPLFRGFRELAALRGRKAEFATREFELEVALRSLFLDVAASFYNVLALEQDAETLSTQINVSEKRAAELSARRRIGRSRASEVLAVRSAIAGLEGNLAEVRGQIDSARDLLSFLTGLEPEIRLRDDLVLPTQTPTKAALLEAYLPKIPSRPDVKAAERTLDSARAAVTIAKGGHLPSAELLGNYYIERVGVLADQTWDVQATLSLPIFSGGIVQAQVRESTSALRQAELALDRAKRVADQEIKSLAGIVLSNRVQIEALERARELAARNYAEQSREYRLGLVTNLDVLQALDASYESQQALHRAVFTAKLNELRLQAAAALRPRK